MGFLLKYTLFTLDSISPLNEGRFDSEKFECESSTTKKSLPFQIKVEPESEISIEFESVRHFYQLTLNHL